MTLHFPILLAVAIDASWLIATVVTGLFGSGGGARMLWNHWVKKEEERKKAWTKVVADKDILIADHVQALEDLRIAKDKEITRLQIELSKKSDAHAVKIEELMGMAMTEVKGMAAKTEQILDRSLSVQAEFSRDVRKLTSS